MIEHPTTGTGQVEALKGNLSGYWSRRIDKFNTFIAIFLIFNKLYLFLISNSR